MRGNTVILPEQSNLPDSQANLAIAVSEIIGDRATRTPQADRNIFVSGDSL